MANDLPDWQAKAVSEAQDEQRRQPMPYPSTKEERLALEYTPELKPEPEPDNDRA